MITKYSGLLLVSLLCVMSVKAGEGFVAPEEAEMKKCFDESYGKLGGLIKNWHQRNQSAEQTNQESPVIVSEQPVTVKKNIASKGNQSTVCKRSLCGFDPRQPID